MKAAEACHRLSGTFDIGLLQPPYQHYEVNVGDAELTVFLQQVNRKVASGQQFGSLMEVAVSCPQDIFLNINKLL